jgi:hypothetical protein
MDNELLQRGTITVVAALVGVLYLVLALLARRRCASAAPARYAIAACGFVIAALVALRVLTPIIAYSILCFSLAMAYLADLIQEEHTRRRRVAVLSPRPAADRVPTVWIAITLVSTLTFVPYVLGGIQVVAALIAGGCALAMAAIAWRIASAPTQLTGEDPEEDPQIEQLRDRASRARRTGLTCVVAIGSIALFVGFVNATPPAFGGLGRVTVIQILLLWAVLWIWQTWYVRRVSHSARIVSP